MSDSPGRTAFQLSFTISPIIFTGGGIASFMPGGMLPIVAITEALNFTEGLLGGGVDLDLNDFFAHFVPLPGGSLIRQAFGKYPFANQSVAANATIRQPLNISMRMICPARDEGGYATKLATMAALQAAFNQHNASGGTYTVATPAFIYTKMLMGIMTDTSSDRSAQAQNTYQIDFEKPLLTLQDAIAAQSNLMAQITNGTPIIGAPNWSGLNPTVGNPMSLAAIGTQPIASGPAAFQAAGPNIGGPGPLLQ